jgi:hypothetical protein
MLLRVRAGTLTPRDVKNEGRSGYVYENTSDDDKMSIEKHGIYTKICHLHDNRRHSVGLFGRNCTNYAINRGEAGPSELPLGGCDESREVGCGTGVRSCEKINNLAQRRQGAKLAKNSSFVFFASYRLCAFA